MNILVIGKFYTEGFALHIAETLSVMGHAVRRFESGFRSGRIGGRLGHRIDQVRGVMHNIFMRHRIKNDGLFSKSKNE